MRGDITSPTAVVNRRPARFRAVTRAAAATVAAVALSTGGAFALPASAEPVTVETSLAEHTNPAVQVITTEYQATASLGRIQFSKAGQQLVVRAYVKLLHREFGAAGFVSYIFDRAQRDPAYYFAETGAKRTQKLSAQFVGSGFIASPDGYVLTARHVVTPDAQVKTMFAQAGAANFARADANALLKDFAKFDLSTGAMNNIVRTVNGFAQAKVHVTVGAPKVAVRLGVASATGQRVGQNQPAEVVFRSDPALGADVAVLRIRVNGQLPTVPLGSDSPQQGDEVYINAFPAAATYLKDFDKASQLQPTLSKGSITALKNTSGGTPILQTDANAMPGSSGGAAFDDKGEVIGMLVSGAVDANGSGVGQNYLMPLDVIKDALTRSGANPSESQTSAIYDQALTDYHQEYYRKALGEFQQVKDLFPAQAYVGDIHHQVTDRHRPGQGQDARRSAAGRVRVRARYADDHRRDRRPGADRGRGHRAAGGPAPVSQGARHGRCRPSAGPACPAGLRRLWLLRGRLPGPRLRRPARRPVVRTGARCSADVRPAGVVADPATDADDDASAGEPGNGWSAGVPAGTGLASGRPGRPGVRAGSGRVPAAGLNGPARARKTSADPTATMRSDPPMSSAGPARPPGPNERGETGPRFRLAPLVWLGPIRRRS